MMIAHIPYYLGNCDILIYLDKFKYLESMFIMAGKTKIINSKIKEYFKDFLGICYED